MNFFCAFSGNDVVPDPCGFRFGRYPSACLETATRLPAYTPQLDLLPPYGPSDTSSWGANILLRNGTYHMVASEMSGHCGLHTWTHNSFLRCFTVRHPPALPARQGACCEHPPALGPAVPLWQAPSPRHASAPALEGPYTARESVLGWFSHNAMPYTLPNGTVVVYHVGTGTPRGVNGVPPCPAAAGSPALLPGPASAAPWPPDGST
eukprot:gene6036-5905_t